MNVMDSQSIDRGFELVRAGMDRLVKEVGSGTTPRASPQERLATAVALPERASATRDLVFALNELIQLETCAGQASQKLLEILGALKTQEKDGA